MFEKTGKVVAISGALVLAFVLIATGYNVFTHRPTCGPGNVPAGVTLFAKDGKDAKFGANGQLCLAWRPELYFKKELAARKVLEADLKTAQDIEDKARQAMEAAAATEKANSETRFRTAQTARQQAQAKIADFPTSTDVAIFIDSVETGANFKAEVPVSDTPAKPRWESVSMRAPEDSASAAGKAWRDLLRGIGEDGTRPVRVGLGDHEAKLPRSGAEIGNMKIAAFEPPWLIAGGAGFLLLVIGLFMWGWNTSLLRATIKDSPNPPFSLGRVQMAWWFLLTLGGFIFIWLTSAQWIGVMTSSVLALLGISGISGLASVAIDTEAPPPPPPGASAPTPETSKGFWMDILSDGKSVALHRVQMFTWTLILGFIFAWSVVWNYAFPTFDTNLLILAGIVNGVYLGFKFPENQK